MGAVSQSHLADCDDRLPHLIRRLNELRLGSWKTEFVNENLRAEILSMKLKSVHHTLFKTSVLTSIKCKSMFAVQHSVSHAQTLAPQSTSCSFICSSYFSWCFIFGPPLDSSSVQPRCRVKKWGAGKTLSEATTHLKNNDKDTDLSLFTAAAYTK